jgi:hypothetical protein
MNENPGTLRSAVCKRITVEEMKIYINKKTGVEYLVRNLKKYIT